MMNYSIYDMETEYAVHATRTFAQIFETADNFIEYYGNGLIPKTITDASARTLYYLLYARFANSPIANRVDETQFVLRLMSTIFQYGPAWEKRLDIQQKIRGWTEQELLTGSTEIYNTSLNPSSGPVANSREVLTTVNQQNASMRTKDKMNAYAYLLSLLEEDFTEAFLSRFDELFLRGIISPTGAVIYSTTQEDPTNV